jgi:hypothetical protein
MAKLSTDLSTARAAGPLHPRENLYLIGALASAAAGATVSADGCSSFLLTLSGTFVATLLVEGSVDGSNWYTMPMRPYNVASTLLVVSATAAGQWVGTNPGFTFTRVRCSAFTSGSASFALANSLDAPGQLYTGTLPNTTATATGASGAAVTLTIASPGAGLRHYLTNLRIERHTSALLTAGATPTVVTTTNIPGALAYSIPADAAAAGVVYAVTDSWAGLATSAQATATTIVAPLTTGVIWRITAAFFVAP